MNRSRALALLLPAMIELSMVIDGAVALVELTRMPPPFTDAAPTELTAVLLVIVLLRMTIAPIALRLLTRIAPPPGVVLVEKLENATFPEMVLLLMVMAAELVEIAPPLPPPDVVPVAELFTM